MKKYSPFMTEAKKAHGFGASGEPVHHWIVQRVTAIALIPLVIFMVYTLLTKVLGAPVEEARQWIANPLVGLAFAAFIVAVCTHARYGLQVVIEDYITKKCCKIGLLVMMNLAYFGLMFAGLAAIIKLSFMA